MPTRHIRNKIRKLLEQGKTEKEILEETEKIHFLLTPKEVKEQLEMIKKPYFIKNPYGKPFDLQPKGKFRKLK